MDATSEFWKAVNNAPKQQLQPIEYRVYYEGTKMLFARSDPANAKWPEGDSILITEEVYKTLRGPLNYRVVDETLVEVRHDPAKLQLEKAEDGKYTSLKDNIIFAAKEGDKYRVKEHNVTISSIRK